MRGAEVAEIQAFKAVAEHGSFSRAARSLGVTPSAMSQTIRTLERRLGIQLLNRTTRTISLTEAGSHLLSRVAPALAQIPAALLATEQMRGTAVGSLRIITPRTAYVDHLQPVLQAFYDEHRRIVLDITVSDEVANIVSGGFDVGVRPGELLEDEVIAIRLSNNLRQIATASPSYLARHGTPNLPKDLLVHRCIGWRQTGSLVPYAWEFSNNGQQVSIVTTGPLILNDRELGMRAALDGVGIALWIEHRLQPYFEAGQLVPLLQDWSVEYPGFFAFYRKQEWMSPALRAFVSFLRKTFCAVP